MYSIVDFTLVELIDKIKNKEVSSKEITNAYIERCKKSKKLNSFITEDFDHALKKADAFDNNPDFEKKLPESALNMGNMIIVLNEALENPEVKKSFDDFNNTLSTLLKQFLETAAFVLEEFKPALMQQGNEIVQYAGEMGQASGDAFVKGGMSALGTIPGVGQVVNIARLNAAISPLAAKSMRAINIANNMLDKITQKLKKVDPVVTKIGEPVLEAQQKGKALLDNISKQTQKLEQIKSVPT